jgi:magnesium transporter
VAFFSKRYHPAGTPPGTLSSTPHDSAAPQRLHLLNYTAAEISVQADVAAADCGAYLGSDSVTWVHVEGRPTEDVLKQLAASFRLHELALEDVLNTGQRPKVEPFEDQHFVVASLPVTVEDRVQVYQASFFLGKTFVVSFCEADFSPFESIQKRLQLGGARIRARGADFLLYSLLDVVIDQGFPVLEYFGSQLEDLEERILEGGDRATLEQIHTVKRELILLRRMLWPQRDLVNQLLRDDHPLVRDDTGIYLRDCYDHTIQVMDLLETYRDMTSSMLDIYLSSVSNRMNDIMRVLTVISTIFIPLTFVVGVYGMNFDRSAGPWSMPELGMAYAYPIVWLIMIAVAVVMLLFFRRRGWL